MSTQRVLERIKIVDRIIEENDNQIVSEGVWETDSSIRKKTFTFVNDRLKCVKYEYVSGNARLAKITPTFCE
jgi:hypothetical protein